MVSTRATSRAYVRLPATIRAGDQSWTGRTRDLSQGGTLVFVEPPYPAGACEVDLELPSGPLHASAEVRFMLPGVGVGLQFVNLDDDMRNRLDAVVNAANEPKIKFYLHEVREGRATADPEESAWAEKLSALRVAVWDMRDPNRAKDRRVDIALQGPASIDTLAKLTDDAAVADDENGAFEDVSGRYDDTGVREGGHRRGE